ncbi:macrophomate synthase [Setomelanomma holmii]|uniref:Macrophomate synthase n=1 Tax=Setomelanomma holmii TaxID=210430 RepID=A0A9P4LLJ1_9PLEO|nr:macrophomate synthase [Setomelanomma holmii]
MADFKPYSEQKELHANAPYRSSMLTYPGNLKQAFADAQADPAKTLVGIAHGIPSTFVTKLIASTKPDFIFIDVEHGMFNRLELHDAVHAAQHHSEGRTQVIVRVPKHDEISLTTALDAGAAGIIIPHTESAEEVKKFIKEAYFGPIGQRSFSPWTFTPGLTTSLYPNDPYNVATSNRHVCIIPQIESVKGVANVEEIAAVPGVSALMFGPGDFMIDAGLDLSKALSGTPEAPFLEAMGKFGAAAAKNNLPTLGGVMSLDQIPQMIQSGTRIIAVQFDVWGFTRLMDDSLNTARGYAKQFEGNANGSILNGQPKPE